MSATPTKAQLDPERFRAKGRAAASIAAREFAPAESRDAAPPPVTGPPLSSEPAPEQPAPPGLNLPIRAVNAGPIRIQNFTGSGDVTPCMPPQITRQFRADFGGWPKTAGGVPFVPDAAGGIWYLKTPNDLIGWATSAAGANVVLDWRARTSMVAKGEYLAALGRDPVESYLSVEIAPHQPPRPRTYYHHPALPAATGFALERFVSCFNPLTPLDRDLIRAAILTVFWGSNCGRRPLILVEGAGGEVKGQGSGKTFVGEALGKLGGGYLKFDLGGKMPSTTNIESRMASAPGTRVVLFDNVKSGASSSLFEGWITASEIQVKMMYFGNVKLQNNFTWVMTVNDPALSKDMADRAVPIRLARPQYTNDWQPRVERFIELWRWEIIADVVAMLNRPVERIAVSSRWGEWEQEVLARASSDPVACQQLLAERRGDADDDARVGEMIRDAIAEGVSKWLREDGRREGGVLRDPEQVKVRIPNADVYKIVRDAKLQKYDDAENIGRWMRKYPMRGLTPKNFGGRVWIWCGDSAGSSAELDWGTPGY